MARALMAHPELRHPHAREDLTPGAGATVLLAERTVVVDAVLPEPGLWVSPADLTRINGFVLKPEGACLDDLCVPLPVGREMLREVDGREWFDVAAFAEHLGQSWVHDADTNTWSFGDLPTTRDALLRDGMAPELALTDRAGEVVRLSDFRGKKTLVVTWSSW